jgi:hypothetical protein
MSSLLLAGFFPFLLAGLFLLCLGVLFRRYNARKNARKKRRKLFLVKRPVANENDQNKHPVTARCYYLRRRGFSATTFIGSIPPSVPAQFPSTRFIRPAPKLVWEQRPKSHSK